MFYWSEETNVQLYGHTSANIAVPGGGSIILCGCFYSAFNWAFKGNAYKNKNVGAAVKTSCFFFFA